MFSIIFIARYIYVNYIIWTRRPCIPMNIDMGLSIVETNGKNYVVGGIANSVNSFIMKVDEDGKLEWGKIFEESLSSISDLVYDDGKILVVGYMMKFNETTGLGNDDLWLMKITESGEIEWSKTIGSNLTELGRTIVKARNNGYLIGAVRRNKNNKEFDIWLLRIDEDGNVLWNKTYGNDKYDDVYAIIKAIDGGYIILGVTIFYGPISTWILKINETGEVEWNKTYSYGIAKSIIPSHDGYIIVGWTEEAETEKTKLWLVKINESGSVEWNKTYDYLGCHAITQSSDGGYMLLGGTRSNETGIDILLIKIDEEGNIIWNKTYGEKGDDFGFSIIHASNNGYVIVGRTTSFGADGVDILLMKVSEDGELEWVRIYSGKNLEGTFYFMTINILGVFIFSVRNTLTLSEIEMHEDIMFHAR